MIMADAKDVIDAAQRGEGCLGRAAPDEPVFVLRAQDKLAAPLVKLWAELALLHGCDILKCQQAYELADEMIEWALTGRAKFPD